VNRFCADEMRDQLEFDMSRQGFGQASAAAKENGRAVNRQLVDERPVEPLARLLIDAATGSGCRMRREQQSPCYQ
jgi:hypothetical protein